MLLYLTQEEHTRVAVEIIRKYPFLKPRTGTGSPTGAIVQTIITDLKSSTEEKTIAFLQPQKLPNMKKVVPHSIY